MHGVLLCLVGYVGVSQNTGALLGWGASEEGFYNFGDFSLFFCAKMPIYQDVFGDRGVLNELNTGSAVLAEVNIRTAARHGWQVQKLLGHILEPGVGPFFPFFWVGVAL